MMVYASDSSGDGKTKGTGDSKAIVLLLEYTKLLLPSMNFLSNFKQLYHMHK